jgi:hypothetical protein
MGNIIFVQILSRSNQGITCNYDNVIDVEI